MGFRIGCRADDADKHASDVNCLVYKKGKLYSGGNDGKIKCWSNDLTKLAEVQAHDCPIYSVAASDDAIYSCSSDGAVKSFTLDNLSPKEKLIHEDHTEFWKLYHSQGCLYAGDDEGSIKVWKNNQFFGSLLTAEPIKDMAVSHHIVFTVKDSDVCITEVKVDGETLQFGVKKTYTGRAPLTLIGEKLFSFVNREGKDIIVHENNDASHFPEVTKVEGAHGMVINALAGTTWNDKPTLFSGGWDKKVKKWIVDGNTIKANGDLDLDLVVNAIAIGDQGRSILGAQTVILSVRRLNNLL
ncbi:hypothetical protein NQ318_006541 [Aromia moschata]|uniref:Uncharacterized protein n=1 Tax=Aromia moschata TaxID=1265417 RepID=A0AAV8YQ57_9CUCU|nr:hypothetical protein NQ318_006541 [Aromia moschata]